VTSAAMRAGLGAACVERLDQAAARAAVSASSSAQPRQQLGQRCHLLC
jgi:hypothetical protein